MADTRAALVTGGASGIGRATVDRLLAAGWRVVVADYNAATMAGILGLTQSIALEYARKGIRANAILPGLMNTPMIVKPLAGAYGGDVDKMLAARAAQCPTGKMGDAWDVAYAALYLASDEAKYVTGAQLIVDGGLTCKVV